MRAFHRTLYLCALPLIGTLCIGCGEESAVGKSNSNTPAFGPTLVIKASAPGLSAEEIAALVAAPIEKQLGTLDTLPLVEAVCTEGQAEFLLHTKADCNLKQLESLVRDRLASAREKLPQSVDNAGLQIQTKTAPLFIVTVFSPEGKHDTAALTNYVEKELRDQLSRIPGVNEVTAFGINQPGDSVLVKEFPGIALLLAPTIEAKPGEVAQALKRRLGELRPELPAGMFLTLPIDAASADPSESHMMLELQLPANADEQQKFEIIKTLCAKLQGIRGLKHQIGFTRHPLESEGLSSGIVLSLMSSDSQSAEQRASIQRVCATIPGSSVRLKNFGKPDAATLRTAISGPDVKAANDLAIKLANQLRQSGKFQTDPLRSLAATSPRVIVKPDASKLAALGINSAEVAASLSEALRLPLKDDPTRGIIALPGNGKLNTPGGLAHLRVKNAAGQDFALSELATIEFVLTKLIVYRINNQPAVLLATQVLGEQNGKAARDQINTEFETTRNAMQLGEEYRLTWLED